MSDTSKPFRIRDAREDDRAAIRDLTWAAYEEYATIMAPSAWAALKAAVTGALATEIPAERIVAEQDGVLVGSVMLFPPAVEAYGSETTRSKVPELRLLAVASKVRGQGVGQALVDACVHRAQRQGATALGLHTSDSMSAAIRLYERMGFVRVPEHDFQPAGAELVKAYQLRWSGLTDLWNLYRTGGLAAAARATGLSLDGLLYLALLAFADERYAEATAFAERAARASPEDLLSRAAAAYLARVAREGKRNVYVSEEGFGVFIRGGGNVPLYQETSAALARFYPRTPFELLDIGVGDGMALLPALTPSVRQVTLVEPAAPLLERTTQALSARGVRFETFSGRLQEFAAEPGMQQRRWEVAQATFCLHSLPPSSRLELLRWLSSRCEVLLLAEFDAPRMDEPLMPELVRHVLGRYRVGLAEYVGADFDKVAQGFLMPVLFGYVDRSATRTTFEHPMADWEKLLREAGFTQVDRMELYPYWWAPACLLVARAKSY
jgi:predicted N-acetyltransferase YhbS